MQQERKNMIHVLLAIVIIFVIVVVFFILSGFGSPKRVGDARNFAVVRPITWAFFADESGDVSEARAEIVLVNVWRTNLTLYVADSLVESVSLKKGNMLCMLKNVEAENETAYKTLVSKRTIIFPREVVKITGVLSGRGNCSGKKGEEYEYIMHVVSAEPNGILHAETGLVYGTYK
ncbi:MAG: hypothetical protein QXP42_04120 [Candidatus Micrarchaeia archaeon]